MGNKELMLTLWNYCNNRCRFCYNIGYYNFPMDINLHLRNCINLLDSDIIKQFNCIRLVGGELFDDTIQRLNIEDKFNVILNKILNLLKNNQLKEVNIVTNLLYEDRISLCKVLDMFKDQNITLSTSYDWVGRFSDKTENIWWQNIDFLKNNYPNLIVDIGINITQPLIIKITKNWLDSFYNKVKPYTINFNELFTGISNNKKEDCSFKELFPKRKDFLKFAKNLVDWGYINTIKDNKNVELIHYIFNKNGIAELKDTYNVALTKEHNEDGYIDSNVSMQEDIKRIINASR